MNVNIELKQSMMEKLVQVILENITKGKELDRIDYLKCKLGLETFLINVSKLSVIYALAVAASLFWPVFIFHLAYTSIRTYAYGVHSESSLQCTIISCIILIGFPALLVMFQIPRISFVVISVVSHVILKKYAPAATRKNGVIHFDQMKKRQLQNKALRLNVVILMISLLIPNLFIGNLLMIGNVLASFMTTPVAYKILKNEWRG